MTSPRGASSARPTDYHLPSDPRPMDPPGRHRLYTCRVGARGDSCDGCDRRIKPHALAVLRSDGHLYCSESCARTHPDPTIPTDPALPV